MSRTARAIIAVSIFGWYVVTGAGLEVTFQQNKRRDCPDAPPTTNSEAIAEIALWAPAVLAAVAVRLIVPPRDENWCVVP